MKLIVKSFEELSIHELYEILLLRAEVFVVEQKCVYNDLDNLDQKGMHIIGIQNSKIVAYARLLPADTRYKAPSIGRVVVDPEIRNQSAGGRLMEFAKDQLIQKWNPEAIQISAQKHLEAFYGRLGFHTISEMYLEDGIPHIKMQYNAKKGA